MRSERASSAAIGVEHVAAVVETGQRVGARAPLGLGAAALGREQRLGLAAAALAEEHEAGDGEREREREQDEHARARARRGEAGTAAGFATTIQPQAGRYAREHAIGETAGRRRDRAMADTGRGDVPR